MLWGNISEYYTRSNFLPGPIQRSLSEIVLAQFREPKQPQDRVWDPSKDTEPRSKRGGLNLQFHISMKALKRIRPHSMERAQVR